jgi:hypothetical protein
MIVPWGVLISLLQATWFQPQFDNRESVTKCVAKRSELRQLFGMAIRFSLCGNREAARR